MAYITTPSYVAPGYTESQLIDKVKIRMDEIDHNAVVNVGTVDNYPITTMVTNILNECKLDVLMNAPMALLPKAKITLAPNNSAITVVPEIEAAEIVLGDDTLRIAAFHNENWRKPVTKVSDAASAVLSRQNYRYTRATPKTPAVVLIDGTTYLAFPYIAYYDDGRASGEDATDDEAAGGAQTPGSDNAGSGSSSSSGSSESSGGDSSEETTDTPEYGDFTVYYVSSTASYADLSEKAIEAVCWDCAAKVFAAMGMTENYNRCMELYQAALK